VKSTADKEPAMAKTETKPYNQPLRCTNLSLGCGLNQQGWNFLNRQQGCEFIAKKERGKG